MLCDICKKNPATIHIQEIAGNEKKTLHLCQECAQKKAQEDSSFQAFNLAEVLYNISNQLNPQEVRKPDTEHSGIFCPTCGWDYASFRKTGRLGCPDCYNAFRDTLKNRVRVRIKKSAMSGKRKKRNRVVRVRISAEMNVAAISVRVRRWTRLSSVPKSGCRS